METQKRKSVFFAAILAGFIASGPFLVFRAHANECDNDQLTPDQQKTCDELNAKAKAYQKIVELKKVQGTTLSNQLTILENQTTKLEGEIDTTKRQIADLTAGLSDLESRISEKERVMTQERQVLSDLIREYHSSVDDGSSILLASAGSEFDFLMKREDWMSETNGRVVLILRDMAATKKSLEGEQEALTMKKVDADALKSQLDQQNTALGDAQRNKAALLAKTQADQAKYEDLLQKVNEQKTELLDFSASANLAEVFASISSYDKPDQKYWASTSWYYSQRDSRWASEDIGKTNSKMSDWGCAVASVAMSFTKLGVSVTPGTLANKNNLFDRDLIIWPDTWSSNAIKLTSSIAHGNIDWSTIDKELSNGNPVIVYIRRASGGGHYVVIHTKTDKGRYVVHDPYFGANLYLDTSRSLVGSLGSKSATSVNQMIIYNKN